MSSFKIEYLPKSKKLINDNGIYKCFAYEDGSIEPNKGGLINMGFKLQVDSKYFIHVFSSVLNALGGVGDSDYRGVYSVIVFNNSERVIQYKKGDYVGSIGIIRTHTPEIEEE